MAAIYMWPPPGNLVVTTPPYPAETQEEFVVSVDIESIDYNNFALSEYRFLTHNVIGGSVVDVKLIADPVESEYRLLSHSVVGGDIEDIKLIADPVDSEYQLIQHDVVGGEVLDRLIRSFAPTEEFELSIEIDQIDYERI